MSTFIKLLFRDPGFDTTVLSTKLASLVSQFKSFPRHKINQPKTCFGFIILCARSYTALELFTVVSDNVEKFTEWNNIMSDFIKVDRKEADFLVRF